MKKLIAVCLLAACGGTETTAVGTWSLSPGTTSFVHEVGVTDCPQLFTTFTLLSASDEDLEFTFSAEDVDGEDLIDFDNGTLIRGDLTFTLAAGVDTELDVLFNCAQPLSFTTAITVESSSPEKPSETVTINGNVQ